jgi:hypothetical protein
MVTFLCHYQPFPTCPALSDHSPAPCQCPVFLFERSHKGMCPRRDCTLPLWRIRPVAQAATRSMRPCIGATGAWGCFGGYACISVLLWRLATRLVGMPSAKLPTPQGVGFAWLPIFSRRLAASSRLCSFTICHVQPLKCGTLCIIMSRLLV